MLDGVLMVKNITLKALQVERRGIEVHKVYDVEGRGLLDRGVERVQGLQLVEAGDLS